MADAPAKRQLTLEERAQNEQLIRREAERAGVNPDRAARIAYLESNFDPNAKNPLGGASGFFQFIPSTAKSMGLQGKGVFDPVANAQAGAQFMAMVDKDLSKRLGRPLEEHEQYIGHFLGPKGASNALRISEQSPNMPMPQVLRQYLSKEKARDTLNKNPKLKDETVGQFISRMQGKVNTAPNQLPSVLLAKASPAVEPVAPAVNTTAAMLNPNLRAQGERARAMRQATTAVPAQAAVVAPAVAAATEVADPLQNLTPAQRMGVEIMGPGYKAGLGLSMLSAVRAPTPMMASASEDQADEIEDEAPRTAKQALMELPAPNAFAKNTMFMAEGGSIDWDNAAAIAASNLSEAISPTNQPQADAQLLKLPRPQNTASTSALSKMKIGAPGDAVQGMVKKASKTEQKKTGTARQQLEEMQYQYSLGQTAVKDRLAGIGASTMGQPTFTGRGQLMRGPIQVGAFEKGGVVSTAAQIWEAMKQSMDPADIATIPMGLKKMFPVGYALSSPELNEGEQERLDYYKSRPEYKEAQQRWKEQQTQKKALGGMVNSITPPGMQVQSPFANSANPSVANMAGNVPQGTMPGQSTVFRAGGSPEQGETSLKDRAVSAGESAASLMSGLVGSIPAGYEGLSTLLRTGDMGRAAEAVREGQQRYTYQPRTTGGKRETESAAKLLENLSVPSDYVGNYALEKTGSPAAATMASIVLDPLNLVPGPRQLASTIKGVPSMLKQAAIEAYGPAATASRVIKPRGGAFLVSSPEVLKQRISTRLPDERPKGEITSDLDRYLETGARAEGFNAPPPGTRSLDDIEAQVDAISDMYLNKARQYFTTQFGSPNDPIFKALETRQLVPYGESVRSGAFAPYVMEAAKRKQAASGLMYPKDRQAFEHVVDAYDRATGINASRYSTVPEKQRAIETGENEWQVGLRDRDQISSDIAKQYPAGLETSEIITPTPTSMIRSGTGYVTNQNKNVLDELQRIQETTQKDAPGVLRNWLRGVPSDSAPPSTLDPVTREALRRGETIYDIGNIGSFKRGPLSFLNPADLNAYMSTLPTDQIRNMSFPDLVVQASKYNAPIKDFESVLNKIEKGDSVPVATWNMGVSDPLKVYDDGFNWVRATDEKGLRIQGANINHCLKQGSKSCDVGNMSTLGAEEAFKQGQTQVFYLRDPRGRAVTTVEVTDAMHPNRATVKQIKGNGSKSGNTAPDNYADQVEDFLTTIVRPARITESTRYLTPNLQRLAEDVNAGKKVLYTPDSPAQ